MMVPHVGVFWDQIKGEFPTCKEVEPLMPVIEGSDNSTLDLDVGSILSMPRVWFLSKDLNGVIQIQRDRFLLNWRKVRPSDEYPRYTKLRDMYDTHCKRFAKFVEENALGQLQPEQFELTYINHIPMGEAWNGLATVGEVLPDHIWRQAARYLPEPEQIHWRTTFRFPDNLGRLHITVQNAVRKAGQAPILIVELNARGISKDRSISGMWAWFDVARELIVHGFSDVTSKAVQTQVWNRQR
jgi:uncharacterized protein (TIGR04255 family)